MGRGLVIITMEASGTGEQWSVQHPVNYGLSLPGITGALTAGDVTVSGIYRQMTDANTRYGTSGYDATEAEITHRLVAFHRGLMYPDFFVVKVEITDGRKNRNSTTNAELAPPMFGVQDGLSLPGTGIYPSGESYSTVTGGSTAILVSRQSQTPGVANGRFYLRGLLLDRDITAAGPRLLAFNSAAVQQGYADAITTAANAAGLTPYFDNSFIETSWRLGIVHYARPGNIDGFEAGDMIGFTPCLSYALNAVTVRQLARGRKRG